MWQVLNAERNLTIESVDPSDAMACLYSQERLFSVTLKKKKKDKRIHKMHRFINLEVHRQGQLLLPETVFDSYLFLVWHFLYFIISFSIPQSNRLPKETNQPSCKIFCRFYSGKRAKIGANKGLYFIFFCLLLILILQLALHSKKYSMLQENCVIQIIVSSS